MPDPVTPKEVDSPSRVPAYVLWGVGGAALIGGGVMWWQREAFLEKVRDDCLDMENLTGCQTNNMEDEDAARAYDIGAKVAFGVGGAALIGGTVLFFALAPDDDAADDEETEDEGLTVVVAPFHAGLQLVGQF